jgi:hypothetical protein
MRVLILTLALAGCVAGPPKESTIDRMTREIDEAAEQYRAECKQHGIPKIGMTTEQASKTCWKLRRVNRTEMPGSVDDQYVYAEGYVYLHNGIVTAVK